ncbi:hypothetical protein MPL3356_200063 [Mesorhizobium plurifarium]|uniref:Uncharacterized protein n=1 Tax=Mesorhizobium plurifarium TaxID=69974 RepID=A0A090DJA3_MESPL|nr:hypothetical protein MPL3356_200063 [Mesorhizobium plurifarium]
MAAQAQSHSLVSRLCFVRLPAIVPRFRVALIRCLTHTYPNGYTSINSQRVIDWNDDRA